MKYGNATSTAYLCENRVIMHEQYNILFIFIIETFFHYTSYVCITRVMNYMQFLLLTNILSNQMWSILCVMELVLLKLNRHLYSCLLLLELWIVGYRLFRKQSEFDKTLTQSIELSTKVCVLFMIYPCVS